VYYRTSNSVWKEYYLVTNAGGAVMWWDYDTGTNADLTVTPTMGFWVWRTNGTPRARTNCVFAGRSHTNAPAILIATNEAVNGWSWTVFGWPYAAPRRQQNNGLWLTASNQLGFELAAYGGQTVDADRAHSNKGDQIWIWDANTYKYVYWLMRGVGTNYDGRWWSDRTGTFGDFGLEAGRAYLYKHHVATNGMAPTGTNFWWQPTP
jgi:hypothetical protein